MIKSFADKNTEDLYWDRPVTRWRNLERQIRRKLVILDAAPSPQSLRVPPGNRLEALSGDRAGQHSIRINDQFRLCFRWHDGDAYDVELLDYH